MATASTANLARTADKWLHKLANFERKKYTPALREMERLADQGDSLGLRLLFDQVWNHACYKWQRRLLITARKLGWLSDQDSKHVLKQLKAGER